MITNMLLEYVYSVIINTNNDITNSPIDILQWKLSAQPSELFLSQYSPDSWPNKKTSWPCDPSDTFNIVTTNYLRSLGGVKWLDIVAQAENDQLCWYYFFLNSRVRIINIRSRGSSKITWRWCVCLQNGRVEESVKFRGQSTVSYW